MNNRIVVAVASLACVGALLLAPAAARAQAKGAVVEEIVARVNNQIITLSDFQKASAGLPQEVAQDCPGCSQMQVQAEVAARQKDQLRDMIDQQLLIEPAMQRTDVTDNRASDVANLRRQLAPFHARRLELTRQHRERK